MRDARVSREKRELWDGQRLAIAMGRARRHRTSGDHVLFFFFFIFLVVNFLIVEQLNFVKKKMAKTRI